MQRRSAIGRRRTDDVSDPHHLPDDTPPSIATRARSSQVQTGGENSVSARKAAPTTDSGKSRSSPDRARRRDSEGRRTRTAAVKRPSSAALQQGSRVQTACSRANLEQRGLGIALGRRGAARLQTTEDHPERGYVAVASPLAAGGMLPPRTAPPRTPESSSRVTSDAHLTPVQCLDGKGALIEQHADALARAPL